MPTTIKIKNGSGAPTSSDLVQGELAIDLTNKRLYTEDGSANILELGTSPSTIDINAGTIDGTVIGGASAAAGTFTTLTATGNVVLGDAATDTVTVTADVASDLIPSADGTYDLGASGSEWQDLFIDGTANIDSLVADTADINGGTIDGTVIGGASAAAGTFTSITGSGDMAIDTDTLFVDVSENRVGIGTTSPLAQIHSTEGSLGLASISGNANQAFFENSGNSGITIGSGNINLGTIFFADPQAVNIGALQYDHSTNAMVFTTNTAEAMRIDSSGNVGIGTTSPAFSLDVNSGSTDTVARLVSTANANLKITASNTANARIHFGDSDDSDIGQIDYDNADNSMRFVTNTSERMRIDASGNVGIGTSTPSSDGGTTLEIYNAAVPTLKLNDGDEYAALFQLRGNDLEIRGSSGNMEFYTGSADGASSTERMRISSGGDISFYEDTGTTPKLFWDASAERLGIGGYSNRTLQVHSSGNTDVHLTNDTVGNLATDGGTITMSTAGDLLVNNREAGNLIFYTSGTERMRIDSSGMILPGADDAQDLGSLTKRYDDVYATNALIQTSDRNEKQDIEALSEAEQRVAVAAKGLLRKFRWKSKVAEKGDDARIHFGIIAQDLQAAFEAEGLDAGRYAMFIHSTWTDEETGEERSRMGVRYSELLAFIISAI